MLAPNALVVFVSDLTMDAVVRRITDHLFAGASFGQPEDRDGAMCATFECLGCHIEISEVDRVNGRFLMHLYAANMHRRFPFRKGSIRRDYKPGVDTNVDLSEFLAYKLSLIPGIAIPEIYEGSDNEDR